TTIEILLCIFVKKNSLGVVVREKNFDIIAGIHQKVQESFQAEVPLLKTDKKISTLDLKKSVFIAHRFDENGQVTSNILKNLLDSLGYNVKEGDDYEAKDIPDKVKERIDSQDIVICLVTPGDPTWIISEASYAEAKNKYIIFLCQADVKVKKGIIGEDYEHMVFKKDHFEECFITLIRALP
ncbi:hypothetical protein ACFL6G_09500, partial [candidate division KSB1 bacterium]